MTSSTPQSRLADRRVNGLVAGNQPRTVAERIWAIAQDDLTRAADAILSACVVTDRRSESVTRYGFADGSRVDDGPSGISIVADAIKTIREQYAAALLSVRDGAAESVDVHDPDTGGSVAYVRDRRGIVRVENGPDGQRLNERVIVCG